MATSAQCSSSCTVVAGAGVVATPMLTPTCSRTPVTVNGSSSSVAQPLGEGLGLLRRSASGSRTANSSPPSRARTSSVRSAAAQPRADLAQQVVAGGVPEAVVDLLEPVQVEQQQGGGAARRRPRRRRAGRARAARGGWRRPVSSSVRDSSLTWLKLRTSRKVTAMRAMPASDAGDGQPGRDGRAWGGSSRRRGRRGWPRCRPAGRRSSRQPMREPPARRPARGGRRAPEAAAAARTTHGQPAELQRAAVDVGCPCILSVKSTRSDAADEAQAGAEQDSVRSRRTPRIEPTATSTAMSRTLVVGATRSTAATGGLAGPGVQVGAEDEARPRRTRLPRAATMPSSHMLGWKRGHPGADEHDDGHVHASGSRRGRPRWPARRSARCPRARRRARAARCRRALERRARRRGRPRRAARRAPGAPAAKQRRGRGQVGQVVEDDVVRPVPCRAGRADPDAGGEQGGQADGQVQREDGTPLRGRRRSMRLHAGVIGSRRRRPQPSACGGHLKG